ncbi:MAG: hypothetical protein R2751_10230 [Bacteroidales bacterium]
MIRRQPDRPPKISGNPPLGRTDPNDFSSFQDHVAATSGRCMTSSVRNPPYFNASQQTSGSRNLARHDDSLPRKFCECLAWLLAPGSISAWCCLQTENPTS